MGGSSWSDDFYTAKKVDKVARGVPTFDYDHAVKTGAAPTAVHDKLNPRGVTRESRDSDAHPESLAIAVVFDVTGSMGSVPRIMQEKLPKLMSLLIGKGYVEHPQVLFAAVGDYYSDRVPLQVGQFESGVEMDDDVTRIYLEGNGGGQNTESYQLALWFFAHKTRLDCFEKRGKKGYLFLIGDEHPYPFVAKEEVGEVLGHTIGENVSVESVVRQAQELYHVFYIIPNGTSYYSDPRLRARWVSLLGESNVLMLQDPAAVCELVSTTVGVNEGTVDLDGARAHLHDAGTGGETVAAVTNALAPLASSASLARVGSADLPEGGAGGIVRL